MQKFYFIDIKHVFINLLRNTILKNTLSNL